MDYNKLWKILEEMGIPDHLTCLLRNLYAAQEARVRTKHGTTDQFKMGKEYVKALYCSESESLSVMSDSLQPHGLHSSWNYPGQNTVVGSLSLLQGIFATQGLNPGLLHCRQILYQLSHNRSPRILK